jgi:DNA invertase Pin-like site-specific DNA recombinase
MSKPKKNVNINVPSRHEQEVVELLDRLNLKNKIKKTDNDENFEVSKVIEHRITQKGFEFKLVFKGDKEPVWVADRDCNCERLIKNYFSGLAKYPRTVYLICRVSSKNQTGPNHVSLQAQEQKLRQYVKENFGDESKELRIKILSLSASVYKNIPSLFVEIGDCAFQDDVIITFRVDRLSRNIVDFLGFLEKLNQRGVLIHAQDENLWYDENKLDFIQGIVDATKESSTLGKRIKLSIDNRRQRGDQVFGRVPYGYRSKRVAGNKIMMMKSTEEQNTINKIKRAYNKGHDCREIAEKLNNLGITKRGYEWTVNMVRSVINKK